MTARPYPCDTASCARITAHDFGADGCTAQRPDARTDGLAAAA